MVGIAGRHLTIRYSPLAPRVARPLLFWPLEEHEEDATPAVPVRLPASGYCRLNLGLPRRRPLASCSVRALGVKYGVTTAARAARRDDDGGDDAKQEPDADTETLWPHLRRHVRPRAPHARSLQPPRRRPAGRLRLALSRQALRRRAEGPSQQGLRSWRW